MSQPGPGGYGGGGPYGPPGGGGYPPGGGPPPGGGGYPPGGGGYPPGGGGYPPGGGGYPPGGYGPPGYGPQPGYGGYPGAPPAGPAGPPPKKSQAPLWIGVGCAGLLLLGIGGGIAGYLYMRSQVSLVESAIASASAAASAATPATLSPSCAKAVACCKVTVEKSAGANAAAAEQACNGLGLLSEDVCAKQYAEYKRSAPLLGAICP